ncbi:flagellar hook-associated protein FlgL [Natranaerofaba carboxydovora]|uniref:flagellar hook-associated protein FlgL n=1 Tax=Natranaerofaba carboxydovora TaxID=2742683 RepID=UPI001F14451C|nr:flagellar hook-associated protein FlgL [Natranaerofaba carboxydovora]UMZ74995.1 Flagellar hook-associated protein 3 [Natranaerofaba carboxydovora]
MRVTNNMLVDTLNTNLHKNLTRLNNTQEKLSSGKRIHRPSDDPSGLSEALKLRSQNTELSKFIDNVEKNSDWLKSTDSALGEVGDVMQRARELTVRGSNSDLPEESRNAIAEEVKELRDHLLQVANSDQGGKYLFGGHQTTEEPFQELDEENEFGMSKIEYTGNDGVLSTEINVGVESTKNVPGRDVFGDPTALENKELPDGIAAEGFDFDNGDIDIGAFGEVDSEFEDMDLEAYELDEPVAVDIGDDNEEQIDASYALRDEDGDIYAVSEDGYDYHILESSVEEDDLETTHIITDGEDNPATISFDYSVTSGEVSAGLPEGNSSTVEEDIDNIALEDEGKYLVEDVRDEGIEINDMQVNYAMKDNNEEYTAVSQDGRTWYALEDGVETDDLENINEEDLAQDDDDEPITLDFDRPVTTGWVEVEGGDDEVTATSYHGLDFKTEPTPESSMFHTLDQVYHDLKEGNHDRLSNENISNLDKWIDHTLDNRSTVGARTNRMELTKNRLEDVEHMSKDRLSKVEEADMAETIMDLKMQENVHRMALSAGARVIQPTLLDFLQ